MELQIWWCPKCGKPTQNRRKCPACKGEAVRKTFLLVPKESGAGIIASERERQIEVEGWTPERDDNWPWDQGWWHPEDALSDLRRAGALCAAEIDRLQRAQNEKS